MMKKLYDIIVMSLISVFAIDMAAEKAFAGTQSQEEYDEIDAMIAKSNKSMVAVGRTVQKAAKKQAVMEEEIKENVEELNETVEEVTEIAEALKEEVENTKEEMAVLEEVAEEVAYVYALNGIDTGNTLVIKQMIKIKKEMKIIDMKIEKAIEEGDTTVNIDELILLKNMYNLNGVN
jgi:hypothetical protein